MYKLRGMVQAGVPQRDLQAILTQLRALTTPSSSSPPPQAPQSYSAPPSYSPPPSIPAPPIAAQPPYQSQPAYAVTYEQPQQEAIDISRFLPPVAPVPSASTAPTASMPDISGIFSALLKAGVVSASSTPTGAGSSSKAEVPTEPTDPERQARRAYRKSILSTKIKLTSSDVTR